MVIPTAAISSGIILANPSSTFIISGSYMLMIMETYKVMIAPKITRSLMLFFISRAYSVLLIISVTSVIMHKDLL